MSDKDKEYLTSILSSFETRSNKDIQFLMEQAFKAGRDTKFASFEAYMNYIKRELLNL